MRIAKTVEKIGIKMKFSKAESLKSNFVVIVKYAPSIRNIVSEKNHRLQVECAHCNTTSFQNPNFLLNFSKPYSV